MIRIFVNINMQLLPVAIEGCIVKWSIPELVLMIRIYRFAH